MKCVWLYLKTLIKKILLLFWNLLTGFKVIPIFTVLCVRCTVFIFYFTTSSVEANSHFTLVSFWSVWAYDSHYCFSGYGLKFSIILPLHILMVMMFFFLTQWKQNVLKWSETKCLAIIPWIPRLQCQEDHGLFLKPLSRCHRLGHVPCFQ